MSSRRSTLQPTLTRTSSRRLLRRVSHIQLNHSSRKLRRTSLIPPPLPAEASKNPGKKRKSTEDDESVLAPVNNNVPSPAKKLKTASQLFESPRNAWRNSSFGSRRQSLSVSTTMPAEKLAGKFWGLTLEEMMIVQFDYFPREKRPVLIAECIAWLSENAMEEEGLFRRSCNEVQKMQLRKWLEKHPSDAIRIVQNCPSSADEMPHVWASFLKSLFQEMPETALTEELVSEFEDVANEALQREEGAEDADEAAQQTALAVREVALKLPQLNFDVLRDLFMFLHNFAKNSHIHRMGPVNLATCFAPNFSSRTRTDPFSIMSCASGPDRVIEIMVRHAPIVFESPMKAKLRKSSKLRKSAAAVPKDDDAPPLPPPAKTDSGKSGNEKLDTVLNGVSSALQSSEQSSSPKSSVVFFLSAPRNSRSKKLQRMITENDVNVSFSYELNDGRIRYEYLSEIIRHCKTLYIDDGAQCVIGKSIEKLTDSELRELISKQRSSKSASSSKKEKKRKRHHEKRDSNEWNVKYPLLITGDKVVFIGYNKEIWKLKMGI